MRNHKNLGTAVLLTHSAFDGRVSVERRGKPLDQDRTAGQDALDQTDEDKVIPWAEGNGLWGTLTRLVSNLVGVDIVTFFVQNPYACDSAAELAVRVGRRAHLIEPVLENLVAAGFLDAVDMGGLRVFQLTQDPKSRQTLQQYATWLHEGYHWARMVMDR